MNCDERRNLLLLRALGALEPAEEEALRQLLAQECAPVAQIEAEAEAALAQLAAALPPIAPSAAAKSAFLAAIATAERTPRRDPAAVPALASAPIPSASRSSPRPPSVTAMARSAQPAALRRAITATVAITVLTTLALVWAPFHGQAEAARRTAKDAQEQVTELERRVAASDAESHRLQATIDTSVAALDRQVAELDKLLASAKQELARRETQLASQETRLDESRRDVQRLEALAKTVADQLGQLRTDQRSLAHRLAQADAVLAALRSPEMKLIDLAGDKQPHAIARLLWDQQKGVWHLLAVGMTPPPAGRTYELWFITAAQQKIAAGTFDVDTDGDGALSVPVPPQLGPLALAAVTDEPAGGVAAPTGSIQLAGKL